MTTLAPVRRHSGNGRLPARWDPFRELDEMHGRMARLFESTLGDLAPVDHGWAPAVDLEETDDAFLIEAELPGAARDDVTVETTGDELRIHGETKERERTGVLRHRTRRTGRFDYRVTLPAEVDPEQVTASLEAGVLRVTAHKAETVRPRRVEITAA